MLLKEADTSEGWVKRLADDYRTLRQPSSRSSFIPIGDQNSTASWFGILDSGNLRLDFDDSDEFYILTVFQILRIWPKKVLSAFDDFKFQNDSEFCVQRATGFRIPGNFLVQKFRNLPRSPPGDTGFKWKYSISHSIRLRVCSGTKRNFRTAFVTPRQRVKGHAVEKALARNMSMSDMKLPPRDRTRETVCQRSHTRDISGNRGQPPTRKVPRRNVDKGRGNVRSKPGQMTRETTRANL
ncbi:hypothetical protein K0M31_012191 [Melipona bicolor]|uniref:Uncharacterized protein n=1 Tax=Melipona bicolor TaxID=60889 RepID=A0AA40FKY9_9HYME|nr:hypothetical protein K0M31_012191 [Melipona bicolor]